MASLGKRQKLSKGQRFESVEQQVEQLTQAVRISQMLIQQFMQSSRAMQTDLGRVVGMVNDLQYRLLAQQTLSGVDIEALKTEADRLRLKDYQEASVKEDEEKGLVLVDTVETVNDFVMITSTTPLETPDQGIFRSKFRLSESGNGDLMTNLIGKKAGDKVIILLGEVQHNVEVLEVRRDPTPLALAPDAEVTE